MEAVLKKIISDLRTIGYSVLQLDYALFLKICETLGVIINTTQVRLSRAPFSRNLLAQPTAIPFHTDHPEIDVISWFCLDPGVGGEDCMQIIDGKRIINKLTDKEIVDLGKITVRFPPIADRPSGECFLLKINENKQQLYYAPWLVQLDNLASKIKSLEQFKEFLINSSTIEIQLTTSTCVFVDNHRILHGRNKIGDNSRRHLERQWIELFKEYDI